MQVFKLNTYLFLFIRKSNPNITEFMTINNITTYEGLESYYIKKVIDIVQNELYTKTVVWQEVFDNKVEIFPETIVHIWTGIQEEELQEVIIIRFYPSFLTTVNTK